MPLDNDDKVLNRRLILPEIPRAGWRSIFLIKNPYQFIYTEGDADVLSNLKADPLKINNLVGEQELSSAGGRHVKIKRYKQGKSPETDMINVSREELKKLQALGYLDN